MDQVTGVALPLLVTVAVNCCINEDDNVTADGATVMPETEHASDIAMAFTLAVALDDRVHVGAAREVVFRTYAAVLSIVVAAV